MNATTIVIPNGSSVIIEDPIIHLLASLVIPIISIIAVIVIGVLTWNYSKKQHERAAMKDVFAILGETPHKNAEDNIRVAFEEERVNDIRTTYDSGTASVVRQNYDQIGSMIFNNLIPSKQYYISFGILTIVSYFILRELIDEERTRHKYHMAYFTNLAIDCFEFWDKQDEKLKPEITDPRGRTITRQMLGDRISIPK